MTKEVTDTWIVETRDEAVLGIGRYYQGEKLIGLFNFSDQPRRVGVDELGEYKNLLTGEEINKYDMILMPGDFVWMICEF